MESREFSQEEINNLNKRIDLAYMSNSSCPHCGLSIDAEVEKARLQGREQGFQHGAAVANDIKTDADEIRAEEKSRIVGEIEKIKFEVTNPKDGYLIEVVALNELKDKLNENL